MIITGDIGIVLPDIASDSVNCIVTSPPYWGLRDYGHHDQIGLEPDPQEYIDTLVEIFRDCKRVLKDDGTLWLNIGDTYCGGGNNRGNSKTLSKKQKSSRGSNGQVAKYGIHNFKSSIVKPKDLMGIPWTLALALRADGWYLRQDIIWHKPNPMPESVRDRCTKSHEYIFLFSKSKKYYFDIEAIKEPAKYDGPNGAIKSPYGQGFTRSGNKYRKQRPNAEILKKGAQAGSIPWEGNTRQKRSVWSVTTKPFKGAHFATFPPDLIEPCILAGCPEGGTVMDPFFGAGTVGLVAEKHNRKYIGVEVNEDYVEIARKRLGITGDTQ